MMRLAQVWAGEELEKVWEKAGLLAGRREPPSVVVQVSWDSRLIRPGEGNLFLSLRALRDGHAFIGEALSRGASAALMEKALPFPGWIVKDTWQALYAWAAAWREKLHYPLVAITGGAGKTWIKEWLYQLLDPWPVSRSPHSFNSRLGIPLSILSFPADGRVGLVEVAITQPDEMPPRASLIQPGYAIWTPITEEHIQNFGSIEKLFSAHAPLLRDCKWIVAWEDRRIWDLVSDFGGRWFWVGEGEGVQFQIIGREGRWVWWQPLGGEVQKLELPNESLIAQQNALIAAAAAVLLALSPQKVAQKVAYLSPLPHRREWLQLDSSRYLLNDSYHGDVSSAGELIEEFARMPFKKKTVILGGLSPYTAEAHKPVVERLQAHFSPQQVHLIGREWAPYAWGRYYEDVETFVRQGVVEGEAILLKGGYRYRLFEKVLPVLLGRTVGPILRVDLAAMQANFRRLRAELPPSTRIIAVLKAEAYGQGGSVISAFLARQGVAGAAVAFIPEALALRKAGFALPIWVFYPDAYVTQEAITANLEMAVGTWQALRTWGKHTPIHIEIDTGMGRMGFLPEEVGEVLDYLRAHPEVRVVGVFSHLALPEQPENALTQRQLRVFEEVVRAFKAAYPEVVASLLSTGGILHLGRRAAYDAVRVGIGLYGAVEGLTEATALYAPILRLWEVPQETWLNYGFSAQVEAGTRIATIAIGYGDGLLRSWAQSPEARVYLRGQTLRILPPLNMDLMLAALPPSFPAAEGDLVEIWGPTQPLRIFAQKCQTIPYEVLVRLSERIRRIYEWGT
jgi:alanine racemase